MSRLALSGGHPTVQTPFPNWPVFDQHEVEAVTAVVESGQWWMGKKGHPVVIALETAFAKFQASQYALAVTNGSHALEIILRNLGIGPGDEVVIPAYAPVATAMAVLMVGATPILAEVGIETMTLEPEAFRSAIAPRTRAVIPVHLSGVASEIDQILQIASKHQIFVVEDCTHASGAESRGRRLGSLGIAAAFDFSSGMTIAAGEGGMIVTSDRQLYEKCWSQHNCGRRLGQPIEGYYEVGSNYRMAAFQAAVIQIQLERFSTQVAKRLQNQALLERGLSQIPGITPQYRHPQDQAPAYLYLFHYDCEAFKGLARDRFIAALQAEGVPCHVPEYRPLHKLSLFQQRNFGPGGQSLDHDLKGHPLPDYTALALPNTERLAKATIALPHPVMLGTPQQMQEIVAAVQKIQNHAESIVRESIPI